jgi:hypothetical protein
MPFDATPDAEVTARDRMIRLRDTIAGLPDDLFDMRHWHCGSAACIGGWVENLFFKRTVSESTAGEIIGLSLEQADDLFYPPPGIVPEGYGGITRAHAVAVLDHYLATGEIDWSAPKHITPQAGACVKGAA